jgi:hypothetical protein
MTDFRVFSGQSARQTEGISRWHRICSWSAQVTKTGQYGVPCTADGKLPRDEAYGEGARPAVVCRASLSLRL